MSKQLVFKEIIKKVRKDKQLTQGQLAELLGINSNNIAQWEAGNNLPSLDLLIKISDILGETLDYLIFGQANSVLLGHPLAPELARIAKALEVLGQPEHKNSSKKVWRPSLIGGTQDEDLNAEKENVRSGERVGKSGKGG